VYTLAASDIAAQFGALLLKPGPVVPGKRPGANTHMCNYARESVHAHAELYTSLFQLITTLSRQWIAKCFLIFSNKWVITDNGGRSCERESARFLVHRIGFQPCALFYGLTVVVLCFSLFFLPSCITHAVFLDSLTLHQLHFISSIKICNAYYYHNCFNNYSFCNILLRQDKLINASLNARIKRFHIKIEFLLCEWIRMKNMIILYTIRKCQIL